MDWPQDKTLRLALAAEPPTLDWNLATDTTSRALILNIMEPLLDYEFSSTGDFRLQPALIREWESSDSGLTWVVKLEQGVFWSDGRPLIAQHVVDSFERLLNPATGAFNAYHFYLIQGAQAYNQGKTKDFSEVGIEVLSDFSLRFRLESRASYFPNLLALFNVCPIRRDIIEAHGEDWTRPENIVTLGPYRLKQWDHGRQVVLERYEEYFSQPASTQYIQALIIPEASTALNLFETGRLDVVDRIPLPELPGLRERPQFHKVQDLAIEYLAFNLRTPPFDSVLARRALSQAIDRQEVVQLLGGGQRVNAQFLPHGILGSGSKENEKGVRGSPQATAELEALDSVTLSFYTDSVESLLAENLQAQISRSLGTRVELESMEWRAYLQRVNSQPPGLYRLGWMAVYPDPNLFMSLWTSQSHFNTSGWSHPKYDELVAKAGSEMNREKRMEYYREAQKILLEEDVVVVPLFTGARQYLIADRVKEYPLNSLNRTRWQRVELKSP